MTGFNWKESRFLNCALTDDETRQRGEQLADAIERRRKLLEEHATLRKKMNKEVGWIEGEITKLAKVVSSKVEERAVEIECRPNFPLGLVEECRLDTDEIIRTRPVEEKDKLRAQSWLPGMQGDPSPREGSTS